jgi:hypothetical protein
VIVDKMISLFGGGRKAGEVEVKAPDEGVAIRLGRRAEFVFLQIFENEGIDGIVSPLGCINQGDGCFRRFKSPVLGILCSFGNPLVEQVFFRLGQGGVGFGRRHDLIGIIGSYAIVKFTVFNCARYNDLVFQCFLTDIESEFCFSSFLIRSVACITLTGKQRTNILIEVDGLAEQWRSEKSPHAKDGKHFSFYFFKHNKF